MIRIFPVIKVFLKKVSIITVNLNNVAGLRQTRASVAAQSTSVEHIIVDGLSADGSREFLEGHADDEIQWISEKDSGIYDAMNKGLRMATGQYLLFLNSGDLLAGNRVIEEVSHYLDKGFDIVYGNLRFDDGARVTEGFMPDNIDLAHMMRDTLWHPVSFIKRTLFERYGGYDPSFRLCGDYEFFFRVLIVNSVTSLHVPLFIAKYDLRGLTSDVNNHGLVRSEKARVHEKYKEITERWAPGKPSLISRLLAWFR